jgi:hypothetical protein
MHVDLLEGRQLLPGSASYAVVACTHVEVSCSCPVVARDILKAPRVDTQRNCYALHRAAVTAEVLLWCDAAPGIFGSKDAAAHVMHCLIAWQTWLCGCYGSASAVRQRCAAHLSGPCWASGTAHLMRA